jgi:MarR family transcriptional regulator for hemolysin
VLEHDAETSLGYWSFVVFRDFERAVNEELAGHGITLRQSQVLSWLAIRRELTQAQLADLMRLEPPTLVRILDRMERDGWIGRFADPSDGRKKLIRPTAKVRPIWKQVRDCILRVRERAAIGVDPKEMEAARQVLMAIHDNLAAPVHAEELHA